jgi:hypothetical protein
MNTDRLVELVPHYVAMFILAYLVLLVVESVVFGLGFWVEVVLIGVVVFAYRPVVVRLGIGPSAWEPQ